VPQWVQKVAHELLTCHSEIVTSDSTIYALIDMMCVAMA
jgi:hypothetical protein